MAYLVNHSHDLTHVQVFYGGTQVSDWSESQAAVTLVEMKGRNSINNCSCVYYLHCCFI